MTHYIEYASPMGMLQIAATQHGICGLYFDQHKYFQGPRGWIHDPRHPHLGYAVQQLDEYFAGQRTVFDIALDMAGTAFQRTVWQALQQLPFGRTTTYQQVAQCIAHPRAIRAVGTAIGRNPVSIIVPCHRVLGASGALSGYAGGIERKKYLLAFEAEALRPQQNRLG